MKNNDVFQGVGIDWLDDSEWVSTTTQKRSKETMIKILRAAKSLFVEKGYQESTMTDICKAAGVSMGAVYHRFPDKQSIFYTLLEMYRRSRFAQIDRLTEDSQWQDKTAEDILAFHLEIMFSTARIDNGFIRLMERQRIVDSKMHDLLVDWNKHLVAVICRLMEPHRHRIHHSDLNLAITYTHGIIRGALMWALLPANGHHTPLNVDSAAFKNNAYQMASAYLGL